MEGLSLRATINVFKAVAAVSIVGGLVLGRWQPVVVALVASVTVMLANDMLKRAEARPAEETPKALDPDVSSAPDPSLAPASTSASPSASATSASASAQPPPPPATTTPQNNWGLAMGDSEPPVAFKGKLYDDEDFRFIKPNTTQDVMRHLMYRPSHGRVVEPQEARKQFVQYMHRDSDAYAVKDWSTIPIGRTRKVVRPLI